MTHGLLGHEVNTAVPPPLDLAWLQYLHQWFPQIHRIRTFRDTFWVLHRDHSGNTGSASLHSGGFQSVLQNMSLQASINATSHGKLAAELSLHTSFWRTTRSRLAFSSTRPCALQLPRHVFCALMRSYSTFPACSRSAWSCGCCTFSGPAFPGCVHASTVSIRDIPSITDGLGRI